MEEKWGWIEVKRVYGGSGAVVCWVVSEWEKGWRKFFEKKWVYFCFSFGFFFLVVDMWCCVVSC